MIKDIHFPSGSLDAGAMVTVTATLTSATGTPPQNWNVIVDDDYVSIESDTALSMGEFKFTITLPNGKVFHREGTNEVIFTDDGATLEDPVAALGDFPAIVDAGYVPGSGQPTDWDAMLEINDSVDVGGIPLQGDIPGPYFASVDPGETVFISMFGQESMPLALLYGPLNPGAATFPGVGQMDIGGTVNPSTGIPAAIQVLGNGITPMTLLDLFFNTDSSGFCGFCFELSPVFQPGFTVTFQAAFLKNGAPFFELSNAVQLIVN